MPVTVSYPGVYVEEIPSGVHTITGVATSITAFVGGAQRGPADTPVPIGSYGEFDRIFGGMTADVLPGTSMPLYSMAFSVNDFFQNGGSEAVIVRVVNDASTSSSSSSSSSSSGNSSSSSSSSAPALPASAAQVSLGGVFTLEASSPGLWGNALQAVVDTTQTRDPSNTALFTLTLNEVDPTTNQTVTMEKFYNLSVKPSDPTYVVGYLQQNSQLVAVSGSVQGSVAPAAKTYQLIGGEDGPPVGFAEIFDPNLAGDKKGIYALENTNIFNLLVIPPYQASMAPPDVNSLVQNCSEYCFTRRAFLIVDPPDGWDTKTTDQITTDLGQIIPSFPSYAAIFHPKLLKPNLIMGNQIQTFAAAGTLAGIFARTDAQSGVWKAPAGITATLGGVTGLTANINNIDNGALNEIGVNCLRTFPIIGSIVWGSRTLDGADVRASDYKYIPVRRFTLFLEESLYRGTQWVVFEPNAEPLWSSIRLNVGAFMQTLFLQGAFQGTTASQAYFVKCDSESTTQTDIDNGIVNIVVGFAPLKPAEFVVIQIQQMAGAVQS
jgi:phage tail sheath protein FI